jgi:ribosomal-protein-alanine N-acetyltransferase
MSMKLHLLTTKDLPQMLLIEESAHLSPWTEDVFQRCFDMGYHAWGMEFADNLIGFVVFSIQVGECHILNLCIHAQYQGRGYGKQLLMHSLEKAKQRKAGIAFLEVRRSNSKAITLYQNAGFVEIGVRKGYYPASEGREDAIMFAMDLGVT